MRLPIWPVLTSLTTCALTGAILGRLSELLAGWLIASTGWILAISGGAYAESMRNDR